MLHWLAALPALIWAYLLCARGGFWRVSRQLDTGPDNRASKAAPPDCARDLAPPDCAHGLRQAEASSAPSVVAVIPARDEAASIGSAVSSLLQQQLAGSVHVIVVDDASSDGTADVATAAAQAAGGASRLTVLHASPPPPDWTGKLWALSQGVQAALQRAPDYLLFTDADIHHERGHLAALLSRAGAEQRDLVSSMVKLSVDSFAERCLIPAFVFFFFLLYPPRWIASSRAATAGAAGGCILIRPQALRRIGGLAAVRSQIIDDCALARAIKASGGRLWLGLTRNARSLRRYGSFAQIGQMISRTAFNQLRHSYGLLAATVLGLAVTYLAPPLLMLSPDSVSIGLGALAWLLMSLCYLPMVRFYGLSPLWSITLPAIAVFYTGATVHSAVQYRLGRGGVWKGRAQDVRV